MSSFGKDYGIAVCPECTCVAYVNEMYPIHAENQCNRRKKLMRELTVKGLPKNKVALRNAIKNLRKKKKQLSKIIAKNLRASHFPGRRHWVLEDKENDLLYKTNVLVILKERYVK